MKDRMSVMSDAQALSPPLPLPSIRRKRVAPIVSPNKTGNHRRRYILVFLTFLLIPTATLADSSGTAGSAIDQLEFVTDFGANCVARNAKQILIQNIHPSKPVTVKLFRYFGDVRQPGRASYTLSPGDEPLALGCDKIQGRAQRWEIHKAEFAE
ncbi:MAG: hypothetical protein KTR18_12270 [Acidiferrobacterales bacterium]|nr:hypothetical protein [Acidiferrobacterales bacterium]